MTLFSEELENEGSRITYLIGDFSKSKNKWDKVSYEIYGEFHVMCSCALLEAEGILCRYILSYVAIMLHIFQNLIYYRGED